MRTIVMFAVMAAGFFCPRAASLSFLIPWLIVVMMYMAMLRMKLSVRSFTTAHLRIFFANLLIALGAWAVMLLTGSRMLAETAFYLGVAPTATATPVVVTLLGGRGDYAVASFVITNFGMALLLPFLIPLVSGSAAPQLFWRVAGNVVLLVCVPLAAAKLTLFLSRGKLPPQGLLVKISFGIWLANIFLIISNASDYLRTHRSEIPGDTFLLIAVLSLVVCALNFLLGRFLDKRELRLEASQSLGQKNTSLTLFLAYEYAMNPLVALGPAFYVAWHNSWNAIQMAMVERRKKSGSAPPPLEKHEGK